jgi:hypothetical protein
MPTLFYKDYTITTGAERDEITGSYRPVIEITWETTEGKRHIQSFALDQQCFTLEEARTVAFHEAKAWADRWLTRVRP